MHGVLRRGSKLLIAGAASLGIGILLITLGFFKVEGFYSQENVFVQNSPLAVGESKELTFQLSDTTKQLNVLGVAGGSQTDQSAKLHIVLTDPNGKILEDTDGSVQNQNVAPTIPGSYKLVVTNVGESPTILNAAMRQPQAITSNSQLQQVETSRLASGLGLLIPGSLLTIGGIIVLIIGGILAIKDRGKGQKPAPEDPFV